MQFQSANANWRHMDTICRNIFAATAMALGCFGFVQQASAQYACQGSGDVVAECKNDVFEFGWMGYAEHGTQTYITTNVNPASDCRVRCDVSAAFFTSAEPFYATAVPPGY